MGRSRLLSKLANLLRKTCIKIGWADTRLGPPGEPARQGQTAAILALLVSFVATRRSGVGHGGEERWHVTVMGEAGGGGQGLMGDNRRSRGAAFHPDAC